MNLDPHQSRRRRLDALEAFQEWVGGFREWGVKRRRGRKEGVESGGGGGGGGGYFSVSVRDRCC